VLYPSVYYALLSAFFYATTFFVCPATHAWLLPESFSLPVSLLGGWEVAEAVYLLYTGLHSTYACLHLGPFGGAMPVYTIFMLSATWYMPSTPIPYIVPGLAVEVRWANGDDTRLPAGTARCPTPPLTVRATPLAHGAGTPVKW
jgi:hypothetical protein